MGRVHPMPTHWAKPTYHGPNAILLLHFLFQLLEAGFHALVEGPQRLRDLVPMNPDPFSQKRNLQNTRLMFLISWLMI